MQAPLWTPSKDLQKKAHLTRFMHWLKDNYQLHFTNYKTLYNWSINHPENFWLLCSEFCKINLSQLPTQIIKPHKKMQKTRWFIDAKLNFAENLLWRRDDHTALIYHNETGHQAHIDYQTLFTLTAKLSAHLKSLDVQPGDRIAAFCSNRTETVIAMLASASIGAIWSTCSPEFSTHAVIERFSQIEPVVLFAVNTLQFQGKTKNLSASIDTLQTSLPSLKQTIIIGKTNTHAMRATSTVYFDDIIKNNSTTTLNFLALPFDHPLYVLYSSGTTGKPKCMVHGAGNTLLQHKKELMLHTDLHDTDTIFFYTTCSWMMWHWLISSLSVGATLVLYDGAPFYPSSNKLIHLIDQYQISFFGAGAKIYETWQKQHLSPSNTHSLASLRVLLSTGSPLLKNTYKYLYSSVKKDVRVSSMSGGSDLISCFALGNPLLPVYPEEIQCCGLGMSVEIFNDQGKPVINETGELVCTKPFPSMPLYFWNDPDGEKYQNAYFNLFRNIWTHGDFAKITPQDGLIIYGRSDATLNPGGVRVGTADIYQQVLKIEEVTDCIAISKKIKSNEVVILFVTLQKNLKLNEDLIKKIKITIRENTTPFHTPKFIYQAPEIPKTLNGKTMEIAVKNALDGKAIKNKEALANPSALDFFYALELPV